MKKLMKKESVMKNTQSLILVMSLIVIVIVFTVLSKGIFLKNRNISMLARQATVVGVISIAMMFVIIAGHIDLSIGSVLGCCGTIAGALMVWKDWGTVPTILAVIVIGVAIGAWNGYWVAYRKIPAFIATLASMLIFKGAKLGIGKSMSIAPMTPSFTALGQSYLTAGVSIAVAVIVAVALVISMLRQRKSNEKYGIEQCSLQKDILKCLAKILLLGVITFMFIQYQGIPVPVIILAILAVIFNFVAKNTTFGRSVYAIGGNTEAANLAGIKTKRVTLSIYMIAGALAACAGILLTARLDAATAAAGDGMELDAIASCVLGGVSMSGGSGNIGGVIIGALIMAALDNGMSLINLENYWQFVVKGLVLLLAVWADQSFKKN